MKNQSFPVFVDYVISEYQYYKYSKWPEIPDNQHWISLERRCWYCDIDYDIIGSMETFADDIKYIICKNNLANDLSLQESLKKSNANNYKKDTKSVNIEYFSQLSKSQVQKLYDIYRMDFELFNYNIDNYYPIIDKTSEH